MKVLAFDVGIKHLAYCILEREINIETHEVVHASSSNELNKDKHHIEFTSS